MLKISALMPCNKHDNFLIEYFILNFLLKKIFGKRYSTWKGNFGPIFRSWDGMHFY